MDGDKSVFRQWHQKFTAALGQFREPYKEIVHRSARETDVGKELGVVMSTLHAVFREMVYEASGNIWKVLADKAQAQVYDKIKLIAPGEGTKAVSPWACLSAAPGYTRRCFTMHP